MWLEGAEDPPRHRAKPQKLERAQNIAGTNMGGRGQETADKKSEITEGR